MIQTVRSTNQAGETLVLKLGSSDREVGLLIFNITGLGPPKASVNGTGGPNFDGIRVTSTQADARHMTMTLAVAGGGELEEEAKQLIYTYFPIKQEVVLGIVTDKKDVYITAIVEENEFNQFSKVENAVISLFCPAPYFIDQLNYAVEVEDAIPLFEFPFENDSLTTKLLEFGYLVDNPTAYIVYTGGVETGADIRLDMFGYVNDVTIANGNGQQVMTLDFSGAETYFGSVVKDSDQVFINTRVGQKSVYFVRNGVWFNMINGVGIDDDWITLRLGVNPVVVTAVAGITNIGATIQYRALSEGV